MANIQNRCNTFFYSSAKQSNSGKHAELQCRQEYAWPVISCQLPCDVTSKCQPGVVGCGDDSFTNVGLLKLRHLQTMDLDETGVKLKLAVPSSFETTFLSRITVK